MTDDTKKADTTSASPARKSRRGFLLFGVAAVGGSGLFAANWFNIFAEAGENGALTVGQAHQSALSGDILLVDIRRPDEWRWTGIGEGAVPIDMRREDFTQALLEQTGGDRSKPVALICARGVRSRRMTRLLTEAGFTAIIDVPEGMLGSGAGPGWLGAGLPLVPYTGGAG